MEPQPSRGLGFLLFALLFAGMLGFNSRLVLAAAVLAMVAIAIHLVRTLSS